MAMRRQEHISAFADLVETRSTALLRLAYVVVGDHQLAQDLVQEALVKAYVAWPRLRDFVLFEWLDDDIVALASGGGGDGFGNILTCKLLNDRCDVTVKRAEGAEGDEAPRRILPYLPLPG